MSLSPSENTPPDWRRWVELTLQDVREDVDYLMHPETGIHASLRRVEGKLKGWAIAILTLLIMNLLGVIIALTLLDSSSLPG